jgi:hypothetical protein
MLISRLESGFVGLSTREYRTVGKCSAETASLIRGTSCPLAPSRKYYTAFYAVNSGRTEFSMLYNFLALLLDFYRLNLHRKPAQAAHFSRTNGH